MRRAFLSSAARCARSALPCRTMSRAGATHACCALCKAAEDNTLAPFSLEHWTPDPAVGAVLCGLDTSVNYTKLSKAFQYLLRPGCAFLATNGDSTYPTAHGLLPGAGSIGAPLNYALGRSPLYIGKPAGTMLECIKAKCVVRSPTPV